MPDTPSVAVADCLCLCLRGRNEPGLMQRCCHHPKVCPCCELGLSSVYSHTSEQITAQVPHPSLPGTRAHGWIHGCCANLILATGDGSLAQGPSHSYSLCWALTWTHLPSKCAHRGNQSSQFSQPWWRLAAPSHLQTASHTTYYLRCLHSVCENALQAHADPRGNSGALFYPSSSYAHCASYLFFSNPYAKNKGSLQWGDCIIFSFFFLSACHAVKTGAAQHTCLQGIKSTFLCFSF